MRHKLLIISSLLLLSIFTSVCFANSNGVGLKPAGEMPNFLHPNMTGMQIVFDVMDAIDETKIFNDFLASLLDRRMIAADDIVNLKKFKSFKSNRIPINFYFLSQYREMKV